MLIPRLSVLFDHKAEGHGKIWCSAKLSAAPQKEVYDILLDTDRLCRVLRNGTPRHKGTLKTVTGELEKKAPAVLNGMIVAYFLDAQTETPYTSPAPLATGCDWTKAKRIVTLEELRYRQSTPLGHTKLQAAMGFIRYYCSVLLFGRSNFSRCVADASEQECLLPSTESS